MIIPFMVGFLLSSGIAFTAYYKEALDTSGATTAIILGMLVYGYGGFGVYMIFISFFLLSSVIGYFNDQPTPTRTMLQVMANGGLATLFIILYATLNQDLFLALFIGSIAISAADTFSSEAGKLSQRQPVSILTLKPMTKGLSGAVTLLGLLAALFAGLFYGFIAMFVLNHNTLALLILITAFLGSIIDSMLGLLQGKFKDDQGQMHDEQIPGSKHVKGFYWLTNDAVNILSNLIGVLLLYGFMLLT